MLQVIVAGVGLALVGAGILIYRELQEEAGTERQRWESQRDTVRRSIERHDRDIRDHLERAGEYDEFRNLVDMHHSCVQVANEAYALLRDARHTVHKTGEAIGKTKQQLDLLFQQKRATASVEKKREIQGEIQSLLELRAVLFADRQAEAARRDEFLARVQAFNATTHELKNRIRDETGWKGREWYERLEARINDRRTFF